MAESIAVESPNYQVVGFFILGTLVMAFLSWRFVTGGNATFRLFGMGLACFTVSFAVWTAVVWARPDNLYAWTSVGVAPLMLGFLLLIGAATQTWESGQRKAALAAAALFLIVLFALRTFVWQSEPAFSERGLFYFNAHPFVLLLYIVSFAAAAMSSIYAVSRVMADRWLARATLVCFNLKIACFIVLLASMDDDLQTYNGYLLGIAMLALFLLYLRRKPA